MNSSPSVNIPSEIVKIIRQINDSWLNGRPERLAEFFHEEMVILSPGLRERVVGREACIQSYKDFGSQLDVLEFRPGKPGVEIFENTAIATSSFDIRYKLDGREYQESGGDVFVFVHNDEKWQAVWRTMILVPPAPGGTELE